MTDTQIEKEIQAKGLTAARVTPDRIQALMGRVVYTFDVRPNGSTTTFAHAFLDGEFYLASGTSACVSPKNFDEQLGKDIAMKAAARNANDKLWELEGYLLRDKLSGANKGQVTSDMVDRFLGWPVPAYIVPDGTPGEPGRSGTNLLDAVAARQMLEFVIDGK